MFILLCTGDSYLKGVLIVSYHCIILYDRRTRRVFKDPSLVFVPLMFLFTDVAASGSTMMALLLFYVLQRMQTPKSSIYHISPLISRLVHHIDHTSPHLEVD